MSYEGLFRARFAFVCEDCDLGYRRGRLAKHLGGGRLRCCRCEYGYDPDVDEGGEQLAPALTDPRTVPDDKATKYDEPPALF